MRVLLAFVIFALVAFTAAEIPLGGEVWISKFVGNALQQSPATTTSAPSSNTCKDPNFCFTTYDSNKSGPNSMWPSNVLDINGWIGYVAYLIIIFLIPIVGLIVLWNVVFYIWCCRKCGNCGGSEPKPKEGEVFEGYNKRTRHILLIPIDIIIGAIIVCTILVIIFSALFSAGVTEVMTTAFNSTDTIIANVGKVENLVLGIFPTINNTFAQANAIADYIPEFNVPLSNMYNDIDGAKSQLGSLRQDISNIKSSTNYAGSILSYLSQVPQLSGVPTQSDIPQPADSNTQFIDEAQNQLTDTQTTVNSTKALVSDAANKFKEPLANAQDTVNNIATTVSAGVTGPINTVRNAQNQYFSNSTQSTIKTSVNAAEIVRVVLSIIFICIPPVVYLIMLLVVYPCKGEDGPKICIKLTSCFTFFTAWIMFIIACVSFVIWAAATNVCSQGEATIFTALNGTSNQFNLQIQNKTLETIARGVFECSGDQDILSVVGISLNETLNFGSYQSQLSDTLNSGLDQFNINTTIAEARANIEQFRNQSSIISFNFTAQINDAFAKLQNVSNQVVLSNFFNQTAYQESLDNLNAYTVPRTGEYFSFENVTLMDTSNPAYDSQAPTLKNAVVSKQTQYNTTIILMAQINYNLTLVNNTLLDIQGNYSHSVGIKNNMTDVYPPLLNTRLDQLIVVQNDLKANVTKVANNILGILTGAVSTVQGVLGCGWIARNYKQTKDTICLRMIGYTGIVGLCAQIIGVLMFVMFPLLLLGTKYHGFKREYRMQTIIVQSPASPVTGDVEMHHVDEGKHYQLERDNMSE